MALDQLSKRPNIVLIITDQKREVMHWPDGWAEENVKARSRATLTTGLYPETCYGSKPKFCCRNRAENDDSGRKNR